MVDGNVEEVPNKKIIKFNPPLYKQRYQFVKKLVEQHQPKKVGISLSKHLFIMPYNIIMHYNIIIYIMLCQIKNLSKDLASKQRLYKKTFARRERVA